VLSVHRVIEIEKPMTVDELQDASGRFELATAMREAEADRANTDEMRLALGAGGAW